jgi:hypothetical protein
MYLLLAFVSGCIMTFLSLRYTFKIYMISANERMKGLEVNYPPTQSDGMGFKHK